jgi:hypothetical protein
MRNLWCRFEPCSGHMPWVGIVKPKLKMEKFLGKKAKDKITGFEGIITPKHLYLTGCTQYGIQPIIDKGRLEIIGGGFTKESISAEDPGSDSREHP